ncbi:DNA topoisomerase III (plasmid) [Cytobacillus spongiae]|uniref:DNA topoisomerase III n=1 Tax=Cytobacillus spongiae TaxID=2901381 RepID=UPI001F425594|nr:DNA topoisomerase III [Cytobacillus spongiae]UII58335.1 DNA topoisomerase III [Cytobacillus spongiae]
MKVIIAEKPDQGATLAKPFPHRKRQGYIEIHSNDVFPKGAFITWAVGHLFQLQAPEKYEGKWKKWALEDLPIIPTRFQYELQKTKAKQFTVIKELLKKREVTEIIHAGDAGREGELIIRNIISMSRVQKPMKRLWISSLTEKAIINGFNALREESEMRSLYYEAYSRACADWLVGMNASRVYSILLKQQGMSDVFSAGRVQTPTLALIVKREEEIEKFKSEPFWEVKASFHMDHHVYEGIWQKEGESRIPSRELAEKIAAFCQNKPATVVTMKTERKEYAPPLLFNLSALQATINKMYKFSPKKTLDVLQKLYQKGIVSYPRSDSQYVTKGEAETFPEILSKLKEYPPYNNWIPVPNSLLNNKRFVNEAKVSDHYAIIPTEQVTDPRTLSGDEQKIYDVVVKRFIAAHHDKAIMDYTTITTMVDERAEFVSKGKQVIQEGWRHVLFGNEKDKDDEPILPPVKEKDKGSVKRVDIKEGKTQPPKRFTEGQLITLMKSAGKYMENDELEKVLQQTEGLGTEATRAGIITMLKDRQYIDIQKNIVYPTDKAKVLIRAIGENVLASAEMTAKWEQRLQEIGKGKASAPEFMEQVKKLSDRLVQNALQESASWEFGDLDTASIQRKNQKGKRTNKSSLGTCLKCGGKVIDKGKFYGCSNYQKSKCSFTISKVILSKRITQKIVKKVLADGKSERIDGFVKGEKEFSAYLSWDPDQKKIQFKFDMN